MNYKVHIRTDICNSHYFIGLTINKYYYQTDDDICEQLNLDMEYYKKQCEIYNGVCLSTREIEGLYFKNENDIKNFKNWLEDNIEKFLIIKKLEGK